MNFPRGIRTKQSKEVNAGKRLGVALLGTLFLFSPLQTMRSDSARADDELPSFPANEGGSPVPPSDVAAPSPASSAAPAEIEARDFAVKTLKRSTSGKTYLFDDPTDAKTQVGKLLLVRREPDPTTIPAMAFRVVKVYPEKHRFAAKRLRRYGNTRALELGVSYSALEKVGDAPIPPPTPQDTQDLKELEAPPPVAAPEPVPSLVPPAPEPSLAPSPEPAADAALAETAPTGETPEPVAPAPDATPAATATPAADAEAKAAAPAPNAFDSDLDAGSAPAKPAAQNGDSDDDDDDSDPHLGAAIEEINPVDEGRHAISVGAGYFRDSVGHFYKAAGLRYGFRLGQMILLKRPNLQDSLTVEASLFISRLVNFPDGATTSGTYTVLPLVGALRYNIHIGESFGVFFYAGVMQNAVPQFSQGDPNTLAQLETLLPAVGTGFFFRVGPSWYTRVDLGYESLSVGLTLRF